MVRATPGATLTDTLFPYTTLFRSAGAVALAEDDVGAGADHRLGHPAATRRVGIGGRPDHRVDDLDVGLGSLGALGEGGGLRVPGRRLAGGDRKSTRLNSSH